MSFTEYIEQDLMYRIQNGLEVPEKLTLEGLSEHYQVSLTPIRNALKVLIDQGYLKRSARGGSLTVNKAMVGTKKGASLLLPERPKNQYEQVANDLMTLSFKGQEVFLREHSAANKYGISRTAMRQIFERLVGLGILEHVPRKGWSLRPFRCEYLLMFAEAREMMEVGALRLSQVRLVEEDLLAIRDRNVLSKAEGKMPRVDNSLHDYLILKSQNLFIKDFFDRYRRYYDVLHRWELRDHAAAMESVRQHRQLAEALIRRDWSEAERILVQHIHHSQAGIQKLFEGESVTSQLFGSEFRQFILDQIERKEG
jgi:DNA-binding GntR family transcriptional regulator